MNKLVIAVILVVAVCSCHGISDRRSIRSASEFSAETNPIADNVAAPQDSEIVDQSISEFTGRAKKGGGGGGGKNKHKMEAMHMGLSYIKMVVSTLMAFIGHIFAFKAVALTLISVLIQITQFVMALKKDKESHAPAYKVVETPWHTAPNEQSYGSYGSYGGGNAKAGYAGTVAPSPYAGQPGNQFNGRR